MKVKFLFLTAGCFFFFYMIVLGDAKKEAMVEIPVSCSAKDCEEDFAFLLEAEKSPYLQLKENLIRLKDGETGRFELIFIFPGTYHCRISQKKGKTTGVSYDDTIYEAVVYVTEDEEGNMDAKTVVFPDNSKEKASSCQFINKKAKKKRIATEKKPDVKRSNSVQTGDLSAPEYWLITAFFALLSAGIVWRLKIRKEENL